MLKSTAASGAEHITCQLYAIFSDGHFIFVFLSCFMFRQPQKLLCGNELKAPHLLITLLLLRRRRRGYSKSSLYILFTVMSCAA